MARTAASSAATAYTHEDSPTTTSMASTAITWIPSPSSQTMKSSWKAAVRFTDAASNIPPARKSSTTAYWYAAKAAGPTGGCTLPETSFAKPRTTSAWQGEPPTPIPCTSPAPRRSDSARWTTTACGVTNTWDMSVQASRLWPPIRACWSRPSTTSTEDRFSKTPHNPWNLAATSD